LSETNINTDPTTLVAVAALRIHYSLMYWTVTRASRLFSVPLKQVFAHVREGQGVFDSIKETTQLTNSKCGLLGREDFQSIKVGLAFLFFA
jgi:hypothetical protein